MSGKPLKDQAALIDLVQKSGEKNVAVEILREGSRKMIDVTPRRRKSAEFSFRHQPSGGAVQFNFVRPGVVLPGHGSGTSNLNLDEWNRVWEYQAQFPDNSKTNPSQSQAAPLAKRLDAMSEEIKELRQAIDELSKALKERK
jgi:hypothetical protein